jgi:hypothetical protein
MEGANVPDWLARRDVRFVTGQVLDATDGTGLGPTGL